MLLCVWNCYILWKRQRVLTNSYVFCNKRFRWFKEHSSWSLYKFFSLVSNGIRYNNIIITPSDRGGSKKQFEDCHGGAHIAFQVEGGRIVAELWLWIDSAGCTIKLWRKLIIQTCLIWWTYLLTLSSLLYPTISGHQKICLSSLLLFFGSIFYVRLLHLTTVRIPYLVDWTSDSIFRKLVM